MKRVIWHPSALGIVRSFPKDVSRELGYLLFKVQKGEKLDFPHSSPMWSIAVGTHELRVRGKDGIYRAFYYLKCEEGVLVFHAFKKITKKTPNNEIKLAQKRLKELGYG